MATNIAIDPQYFYEDVVYRVNKRGNVEFGVVMENDDQDISEESSDSEEGSKRKKGEIRVVWHPSGIEELVNTKKVHLADRTLMPGDVVRRMIKGKDTQRGYCRDIELTACAQVIGTKQVLTNISSEDLIPLEEFRTDIAVCMDSWVGGIRMVHFKLWLETPDGSRCVINEMDAQGLAHFEERREKDNDFPHSSEFYPGQCLWGPVQCLEDANWISCTKEMLAKRKSKPQKKTKMIVQNVKADWVGVHWQCRAYAKDGAWSDQAQPKFLVEGADLKKLKLLNVFEPSTLQVGDRDFYVLNGNEKVISREQWRKQQRELFQIPKHSPRKSRAKVVNDKKKEKEKDKEREKDKNKEESHNSSMQNDVNGSNSLDFPPENSDSSDWDTENTVESQSDTASMSSGGSSMSSVGKKKKGPALMTKVLKKKKLVKAKKKVAPVPLVTGSKMVVETLSTNTKANVVWQDGSVEFGIPSTQLFPIHHLDDKEFFPGDFVIDQKEESRMYGVVQSVDHQGRTAKIKLFKTYTSAQSPQPIFLEEREVSVYDLKDHPDFQYRPGTLVIRIANFEGEDSSCTAGQVIDNYPEGRVKVWWVDGHISMCWPQDLYKVGDYDSDEAELWDEDSSDGSWETELENCFIADNDGTLPKENIKPKLAAHIEKARIAMSRLEEIFTQNPALQTTEVMRRLLEVYKDCRFMDKLMGTSFFHESNFQGLLERVRERGRVNVAQRMADQVSRLFNHDDDDSSELFDNAENSINTDTNSIQNAAGTLDRITSKINNTVSSSTVNPEIKISEKKENNEDQEKLFIKVDCYPEDSGHFSAETSKKGSGSSESSGEFQLSEDPPNFSQRSPATDNHKPHNTTSKSNEVFLNCHVANSQVCVKLCTLIKAQLLLAHAEVSKRFGLARLSLSDATKTDSTHQSPKKLDDTEISKDVGMPTESALESSDSIIEIPPPVYLEGEGFSIEESAPDSHKFKLTMFQPTDPTNFFRTVSKELKLLQSSLPPGVWVKGFDDRIDLYSVMFRGPEKTPYEDGLFLFDFQLSADYPTAPPLCHYISYCSDRLNPNLYEDGKVCVSLLGTWAGRGTELWTNTSTLLQVIVSIQGLILVAEPYFNEAGFDKQKGSQQGSENSRMYNETVILKLVQAQTKLLQHPSTVFKDAIMRHFQKHAEKLLKRLERWLEISEGHNNQHPLSPLTPTSFKDLSLIDETILPQFPLVPASRGFCITLRKTLATFKQVLARERILPDLELSGNSSETSLRSINIAAEASTSAVTHDSVELTTNCSSTTVQVKATTDKLVNPKDTEKEVTGKSIS